MRKLEFQVERTIVVNHTDAAYLIDGDDVTETLNDAMWNAVYLDIHITIGGVTMPAALWSDPDHWAEDWADELKIDLDDVSETVAGILAEAIMEDS